MRVPLNRRVRLKRGSRPADELTSAPSGAANGPGVVQHLQQQVGNQAVSGLVQRLQREAAPTSSAPAGPVAIQRALSTLSDTQKAPTTDLSHPHLTELGITDLGPYKYVPPKKGFLYQPPADADKAWTDTDLATSYQPENNSLKTTDPGVVPAAPAKRVEGASKRLGPGTAEILKFNAGLTPRAFSSVAEEDTLGASLNAHIVARHVISSGSDMKSKRDVALRAGFGMIGGAVSGMYTPVASAFTSVSDADGQVKAALAGTLEKDWATYRTRLAAGSKPDPSGDLQGAKPSGGVVAFESVSGAQLPLAQVPRYVDLSSSVYKGIAPLWAGDPDWQQWWDTTPKERTDYEAIHGTGKTPDPITRDITNTLSALNVRVLAAGKAAGAGGWVVHSAYPTT